MLAGCATASVPSGSPKVRDVLSAEQSEFDTEAYAAVEDGASVAFSMRPRGASKSFNAMPSGRVCTAAATTGSSGRDSVVFPALSSA